MDKSEISIIIENLFSINNREDGMSYLEANVSSRNDLIEISKILDISIGNMKKMKDNIIENTIGFRIRSNAIRQK